MKYPNTFLIGAPKCGTTSISGWLAQHPDVFFSENKELDFFYNYKGMKSELTDYLNNFEGADRRHSVIAEGSVWYLFSPEAIVSIEQSFPCAKYIVCLRNPVEMAISLHAQKVYTGHELERDFVKAWELSDSRARGGFDKIFDLKGGDPSHMAYKKACMLGSQVDALLRIVSPERVKFIVMDDIKNCPELVWKDLQSFLEIDPFDRIKFTHANKATKRKFLGLHYFLMVVARLKRKAGINFNTGILSGVHRYNNVESRYDYPSEQFVKELKEYFYNDVRRLSALVKRDLESWVNN
ncbi:sulfotransferase [Marinobacter sp. MDS2]|uniref:sulfotransferase family protein n=1 Tax=Marinobacter sp. MDS2 TaxID=3065961 RepID=UPI00273BF79B|nr:sulfotransferase [Marinobacter sp. MDS2]MDP4546874.1 sulfotransferase [Marinobacter sp. MDS2]